MTMSFYAMVSISGWLCIANATARTEEKQGSRQNIAHSLHSGAAVRSVIVIIAPAAATDATVAWLLPCFLPSLSRLSRNVGSVACS